MNVDRQTISRVALLFSAVAILTTGAVIAAVGHTSRSRTAASGQEQGAVGTDPTGRLSRMRTLENFLMQDAVMRPDESREVVVSFSTPLAADTLVHILESFDVLTLYHTAGSGSGPYELAGQSVNEALLGIEAEYARMLASMKAGRDIRRQYYTATAIQNAETEIAAIERALADHAILIYGARLRGILSDVFRLKDTPVVALIVPSESGHDIQPIRPTRP